MKKARILIYDIETAPIIGTVWGKYEQNLIWSIQDWYILCFSYRWYGERKKTQSVSLPDFKLHKKQPSNDYEVVKKLHELFSEADIVVAHNGNSFDQKKSQARMVLHGFDPPTPYLQVDTKLVARRNFNFTSNKLDDLGEYFGFGNKIKTDKDLWRDCMYGDMNAWGRMTRYCSRDVELLEKIYAKMLPWDKQHPNIATLESKPDACPRCGVEGMIIAKGYGITKTQTFQRFKCKSCGAPIRARRAEKKENPNFV